MEGTTFELDCAVENEDADVTWHFNDIEITPRTCDIFEHFEFIEHKRKRILRITDCPMAAAGNYKCTTKDDETSCDLFVDVKNKVAKDLENVEVKETEVAEFECAFMDKVADAVWYHKGDRILKGLHEEK